jgi:hypothetical protein
MAKIKFGAMVADARGKHNGVVFTRSRFGAIARAKVSPVQPRGNRQTMVRERVAGLSKRWSSTLTDAQRAAWNAFADQNPTRDVFGNTIRQTGSQAFLRINGVLLNVGGTAVDTPPTDLSVPYLTSVTPTLSGAGGRTFTLAFAPTSIGAGYRLVLFATAQMNAGRSFGASGLRYIATSADNQASTWDVKAAYETKFGNIITGRRVYSKVSVVRFATGALSAGIVNSTVAA